MEIRSITSNDLFASKYCRLSKDGKAVEFTRPTFVEANKMAKRELCMIIALFGLRLRPLDGALENANSWLKNHTKKEILDTFKNEFR